MARPNILDISKSGKNQTRGLCSISYSIFSYLALIKKAVNHQLIAVQMIQRCTNHPSYSESFNAVQIFQRCIIPWLYKSFEVVQILQRSKKPFYVVQIIQRNTNHST